MEVFEISKANLVGKNAVIDKLPEGGRTRILQRNALGAKEQTYHLSCFGNPDKIRIYLENLKESLDGYGHRPAFLLRF